MHITVLAIVTFTLRRVCWLRRATARSTFYPCRLCRSPYAACACWARGGQPFAPGRPISQDGKPV